ncbi:MAG: thioredoxin [Pseudomonadota bacterium]
MLETTTAPTTDAIVNVTARDFDAVVAKANIPVLVDFWAPWCGPCQQIAPVLDAIVAHYPGKIRVAKVNVDEETTLATGFNVRSIPMLLLFKDGKVIEEMIGLQSPEDLVAKIGPHIDKPANRLRRAVQDALMAEDHELALSLLQQALAEEPNNAGILVDIARAQLALGHLDDAEHSIAQLPASVAVAPEVDTLKSEIALARQATDSGPVDELLAALEQDPENKQTRLELAKAYLGANNHAAALEQYYQLMVSDRDFNNDAGREGLLSIFAALGSDNDHVRTYRKKMANFLN